MKKDEDEDEEEVNRMWRILRFNDEMSMSSVQEFRGAGVRGEPL